MSKELTEIKGPDWVECKRHGGIIRSEDVKTHDCGIDLETYIATHEAWSLQTFGPPKQTDVVKLCTHIAKEISEVLLKPEDVTEWVDIIILAVDGALRTGHSPQEIAEALVRKQQINVARKWNIPTDPTQPNEHIR